MTYGTHLRRRRQGILYFRYVLPRDLRGTLGPTGVSLSLGTTSKRDAQILALELRLIVGHHIAEARTAQRMSDSYKPNHAALRGLLLERTVKVLKDVLDESDKQLLDGQKKLDAQARQVERLTDKLLEKIDVGPSSVKATRCPPVRGNSHV